jgi:hypothetical protein
MAHKVFGIEWIHVVVYALRIEEFTESVGLGFLNMSYLNINLTYYVILSNISNWV